MLRLRALTINEFMRAAAEMNSLIKSSIEQLETQVVDLIEQTNC